MTCPLLCIPSPEEQTKVAEDTPASKMNNHQFMEQRKSGSRKQIKVESKNCKPWLLDKYLFLKNIFRNTDDHFQSVYLHTYV